MEPFQRAWIAAEREMEGQLTAMVYQRLSPAQSVRMTSTRKLSMIIMSTPLMWNWLSCPFGELSEKEYPVTESEIKAAYDKEKNLFKVDEATKEISFIAVNIAPSAEDKAEAQKLAENTMRSLAANAGPLDKNLKEGGCGYAASFAPCFRSSRGCSQGLCSRRHSRQRETHIFQRPRLPGNPHGRPHF